MIKHSVVIKQFVTATRIRLAATRSASSAIGAQHPDAHTWSIFWVAVDGRAAALVGAASLVVLVGGWFGVPLLALRRAE